MIKNRVIKTEMVKWKELEFIQPDNFKELSDEDMEKLIISIKNNDFIAPISVYQDKSGKIFVIDGVHRIKAMNKMVIDGIEIPDLYPANFIECKSRKDAAKMVLLLSSNYARVTGTGLHNLMTLENIDFPDIRREVSLEFDLNQFQQDFLVNDLSFVMQPDDEIDEDGNNKNDNDGTDVPVNKNSFPLAIVLTKQDNLRFEEFKRNIKINNDTNAFLKLLDIAEGNND